jgi:hypothetical protein
MKRLAAAVLFMLLASACGEASAPAENNAPEASGPYATTLSMSELMAHVVDYQADGVWLNQGWRIDESGEHELFPTTDAGWLAAENSAASVAEAANVLMMPGRAADDGDWINFSRQLHDASITAMKAAEARDKQAFFDAGGAMYVACRSCHQKYILGEDPTNFPRP